MNSESTSATFVADGIGLQYRGRHCLMALYPTGGATLASAERPLDLWGDFTSADWQRGVVPPLVRTSTSAPGVPGCPSVVGTRFGGYSHLELAAVYEYAVGSTDTFRGLYVASQDEYGTFTVGNGGHALNGGLLAGSPAGENAALIQSTFGANGNLELVAPVGQNLAHYWRNNDQADPQWSAASYFPNPPHPYNAVALLQDVRDNRLHVLAEFNGTFDQWTRDPGPPWNWTLTRSTIGTEATGVPGLWHERRLALVSPHPFPGPNRMTTVRGDFLLGTALGSGGIQLLRQRDGNPANPWEDDGLIAAHRTFRDISVIQRSQPRFTTVEPLEVYAFETGRGLQSAGIRFVRQYDGGWRETYLPTPVLP